MTLLGCLLERAVVIKLIASRCNIYSMHEFRLLSVPLRSKSWLFVSSRGDHFQSMWFDCSGRGGRNPRKVLAELSKCGASEANSCGRYRSWELTGYRPSFLRPSRSLKDGPWSFESGGWILAFRVGGYCAQLKTVFQEKELKDLKRQDGVQRPPSRNRAASRLSCTNGHRDIR